MTEEQLRKIDALIAEHVMEWKYSRECLCFYPPGLHELQNILGHQLPRYSTDIKAAWEVVEKLGRWKFTLTWEWDFGGGGEPPFSFATAIFDPVFMKEREKLFVSAQSPSLAICLAALKSVGIDPAKD